MICSQLEFFGNCRSLVRRLLCALRRAFCEFLTLFGSLPVVVEDRSVGVVDGEMFYNMFIVVTWLKFSADLPALVARIQYVFA